MGKKYGKKSRVSVPLTWVMKILCYSLEIKILYRYREFKQVKVMKFRSLNKETLRNNEQPDPLPVYRYGWEKNRILSYTVTKIKTEIFQTRLSKIQNLESGNILRLTSLLPFNYHVLQSVKVPVPIHTRSGGGIDPKAGGNLVGRVIWSFIFIHFGTKCL